MGFVDSERVRDFDVPKMNTQDVAAHALAGVEAAAEEILAGAKAHELERALITEPPVYLHV